MQSLVQAIEEMRGKLPALRRQTLKETPTRTIIIDPLLEALQWDVRDPSEVQLEYPTVDGKAVDYALKINDDPVLLVEAKPLDDPLDDVKAITQVVGYAANDGIVWCALTNGVKWQIYRSVEKCPAPDKLMCEVNLDPRQSQDIPVQDLAEQLWRLSREEMAKGTLDIEGERAFTDGKVRKALDGLMLEPPRSLINAIRRAVDDDSLTPQRVRDSLARLRAERAGVPEAGGVAQRATRSKKAGRARKAQKTEGSQKPKTRGKPAYDESHHTEGKPREVVELYRALDQFCLSLSPGGVEKRFLKMSIRYRAQGRTFCWLHLQQGGIRAWLPLKYGRLHFPPDFARDVSNVGHFAGGDVELRLTDEAQLEAARDLIRQAYETA